jgi:hypothetical protein
MVIIYGAEAGDNYFCPTQVEHKIRTAFQTTEQEL